jgi:predicted ribosomally synthesized peptide with SipW-like signal peptide
MNALPTKLRTPRHTWPRTLRSARVRAALGLGVVATVGVTGTFAYWTDNATVSGTTFSTGSIDLKVNGVDNVTGYTSLTLANMVPGNSVAGVLTIRNNGTAPLKYTALTTATTPDTKNLRGALVVRVTDGAVTGTAPAATCGGTVVPGSGTALNAALVPTGRLLAAGTQETLCVQVTLPPAVTDPTLQGASTAVDLTFTGTSDLS